MHLLKYSNIEECKLMQTHIARVKCYCGRVWLMA